MTTQDEYRATVREWLAANCDPAKTDDGFNTRHWMMGIPAMTDHHNGCRAVHTKLYEAGYGESIPLPAEYGGQGGEAWQLRIFREESRRYDVDTGFYGSINAMTIPALLQFATEDQKKQYIPDMLSGAVNWCQLFSEPGAGSDLAGLGARAERDGDVFIVNGQKVWNSAAIFADLGILLVRTDPDVIKHAGITFLIADMKAPGVEVRPLVQATGSSHFCEVFFDNVAIPVANVIGEINDGWKVARTVMANESAVIGTGGGSGGGMDQKLIELATMLGHNEHPPTRQQLADYYSRQRILGWMGQRMAAGFRTTGRPAFDPSVVKLFVSDNKRRSGALAMELLGAASLSVSHEASEWAMEQLLGRYSISIGGGTDEVHRNNVGERQLGLPRDIRTDKDIPWKDVPKG